MKIKVYFFQRQEQDGGVAAGSPSPRGGSCCPSRRGGDYDGYDDFDDTLGNVLSISERFFCHIVMMTLHVYGDDTL